jgi:hypothetical protein
VLSETDSTWSDQSKHIKFCSVTFTRVRTLTYSSQTSTKNDLIPSSFLLSCSNTNLVSVKRITQLFMTKHTEKLTSRCNKRRHYPFVEFINAFQIPGQPVVNVAPNLHCSTDMTFSLRITSSITSRLALAIIWITCRS